VAQPGWRTVPEFDSPAIAHRGYQWLAQRKVGRIVSDLRALRIRYRISGFDNGNCFRNGIVPVGNTMSLMDLVEDAHPGKKPRNRQAQPD
jgi:hypothetical protein